MDLDRSHHLTRWLEAALSRRLTLGSGLAAFAMTDSIADMEAKKKCKKKRKKKMPETPTCSELCGFDCTYCFFRADAPPLCGEIQGNSCLVPCASDNDCVGEDDPYCVARIDHRPTGDTLDVCVDCGGCPAGALGMCTSITACNP